MWTSSSTSFSTRSEAATSSYPDYRSDTFWSKTRNWSLVSVPSTTISQRWSPRRRRRKKWRILRGGDQSVLSRTGRGSTEGGGTEAERGKGTEEGTGRETEEGVLLKWGHLSMRTLQLVPCVAWLEGSTVLITSYLAHPKSRDSLNSKASKWELQWNLCIVVTV